MTATGGGDHPVDRLIRELILGRRSPVEDDVRQIVHHVSSASFSSRRRSIPIAARRLAVEHGHHVEGRGSSLVYHWAKHVLIQAQWSRTLSPLDYLATLRATILYPDTRILARNLKIGGNLVFFIGQTVSTTDPRHLSHGSGQEILVIYSADDATIVSGYMVNDSTRLRIRDDVIWLRR